MEANTMKDIEKAIKIAVALEDAKQIAQRDLNDTYNKLCHEIDDIGRASFARSILASDKVIDIIEAIADKYPITGMNVYSRLYNIVK